MSGICICLYNCIKLHNLETKFFSLYQTICYQLFANMKVTAILPYTITCISNVSTSAYIIRMKNIHSHNFIGFFINCHTTIGLTVEKFFTGIIIQSFFLWKCNTVNYYIIPNFHHTINMAFIKLL